MQFRHRKALMFRVIQNFCKNSWNYIFFNNLIHEKNQSRRHSKFEKFPKKTIIISNVNFSWNIWFFECFMWTLKRIDRNRLQPLPVEPVYLTVLPNPANTANSAQILNRHNRFWKSKSPSAQNSPERPAEPWETNFASKSYQIWFAW